MSPISRRTLLSQAAMASVAYLGSSPGSLEAFPLILPLGIQSFDLTGPLNNDFDGTLSTLASYGYQWVDWLAGGRNTVRSIAAMPAKDGAATDVPPLI